MSRTLTLIIIVLALGGAAVLGYRAFVPSAEPTSVSTESTTGESILPLGNELDFESVQKYNPESKIFQYPVVTPGEIGPELGTIIKQ